MMIAVYYMFYNGLENVFSENLGCCLCAIGGSKFEYPLNIQYQPTFSELCRTRCMESFKGKKKRKLQCAFVRRAQRRAWGSPLPHGYPLSCVTSRVYQISLLPLSQPLVSNREVATCTLWSEISIFLKQTNQSHCASLCCLLYCQPYPKRSPALR